MSCYTKLTWQICILSLGVRYLDSKMTAYILHALQGSAADLAKKAMLDIHRCFRHLPAAEDGLRPRLLLQIHDELLFEVRDMSSAAGNRLSIVLPWKTLTQGLNLPKPVCFSYACAVASLGAHGNLLMQAAHNV